jgi:hypothetical protein
MTTEAWGDAAPGILYARLPPSGPGCEPPLVTTLRRYIRRGASQRLLDRIAGGPRHFRDLVTTWDLRGVVLSRVVVLSRPPAGGELGVRLSPAERRIALLQLLAEHEAAGAMMPAVWRLARLFGTTPSEIENDLAVAIEAGRLADRRLRK